DYYCTLYLGSGISLF
nr:immunoglobulin light chain junction region [Macaca mulatta]MOX33343.1 immunoglobulin light chain junction region [Macaca mulatta]MOX34510.1 immunoglobulin light chain junction region [Macaca mulatta]MOX34901.1 immunoglobulin light chain junction region [Macaca mulatta]MOX35141.1 immunoglobulin light chain junction region [Macaca mulatta]